jgi:hypothetical protein
MTGRVVVPVLGGGLTASGVVEPLRNLQLLSLEEPEQAAQAFRELGGTLADPQSFSLKARDLGALSKEAKLRADGWQQIEHAGKVYAWDGPLEELTEGQGVPIPDTLPAALGEQGLRAVTGIPDDLWNEYSKGYVRVWHIDGRLRKHLVVSKDKQVLLVRPEPERA